MGKAAKITVTEPNPKARFHLGVFTASMPLCVGDPYTMDRPAVPGRWTGKQLSMPTMIHHQTSRIFPGTLAPPQMLFAEQKDKYADKTTYRDTCLPERKKSGFLTSDFPRRDEFSNTIRTAQLREVLKKVSNSEKKAKAKIQQRKMAMMTVQQIMADDGPALPDLHLPAEPLFDVVYRIPEASLKLARDDRQANLYYKRVREMINKGETKEKAQRIIGDAAWVNVSIQGRATNLLVTPSGQVLARNVVDKKSHGCGGI